MALSVQKQQQVQEIIYKRALEIEACLSDDDYFLAKLCGLSIDQIAEVSLKLSVKELQKEFSK